MRKLENTRLFYIKPLLKDINSNKNVFVDMHVHTSYTDGMMNVEKIVQKARKYGIGIAITDHNHIQGALELSQVKDVFSIPGIEVAGKEGIHILIYFYTYPDLQKFYRKHIEPNKIKEKFTMLKVKTIDIIKTARKFKCVICAAHPFGPGATGLARKIHGEMMNEVILEGLDAIEIMNGSMFRGHNNKALKFGQVINLGITGGSDAHTTKEIGGTMTYANCSKTISAFLDAVVKNKNKVIGKESHILYKPYTKIMLLRDVARSPILYSKYHMNLVKKKLGIKK